jgi:hypothetical protein
MMTVHAHIPEYCLLPETKAIALRAVREQALLAAVCSRPEAAQVWLQVASMAAYLLHPTFSTPIEHH